MFRAFSDPTRLRILYLLLDGELCVGDLVKILKAPQFKASLGRYSSKLILQSRIMNASRKALSTCSGVPSREAGSGTPRCTVRSPLKRGVQARPCSSKSRRLLHTEFLRSCKLNRLCPHQLAAQQVGPQHALAVVGFVARTKALMNLSCTWRAMESASMLYTRVGSISMESKPAAGSFC